ncbi:progesterone binding protein [Stylonychia lemnae]|uniref:Progesterone binding protein n=1 Tax=Stylonychia lemnae TaxID=5949 RepID=A0A078BCQ7_STYLE|nr:progesterone binding protein [Stylonychia lemnae]|eukprot:CDW90997.1 progesterone binding protein [Stylonychia lemnae]
MECFILLGSLLALYAVLYLGFKTFIGFDQPPGGSRGKGKKQDNVDKYANATYEELLEFPERKLGLPLISLEELSKYKGSNSKLYMSVKSVVYDVSQNEVYKQKGGYHVFTGKDSSVALSKMDFKDEFFDRSKLHWRKDLKREELKVLQDWVDFYEERYPIVGYLKEDIEMQEQKKDL